MRYLSPQRIAVSVAAFLSLGSAWAVATEPDEPEARLTGRLEAVLEANPSYRGLSIAVRGQDPRHQFAAAVGHAAPKGQALTAETPFRTASVTKIYVAATVLRLWEQDLVDLSAPISGLIDPAYDELLTGDGYDTSAITVRHLLMHTAGLPDHADAAYVGMIMEAPTRQWTRADQVTLAVENHDPLGEPGEQYSYSDTGYVLLGDIIERITGKPLATVVRQELRFEEIGLSSTWWEQVEEVPKDIPDRASQFLGTLDTTGWNGSADLYGGGGLISTTTDLSTFMLALFSGSVFDKTDTLALMTSASGHPFPDRYRLGLFPGELDGEEVYSHSGFWGVHTLYAPDSGIAVSGVVLNQEGYRDMVEVLQETARELME
ncbi:MAG: serine hydrolase domain-containing protein [Pseudomonadota bacterium]